MPNKNPLDSLVEALFRDRADSIVIESDRPVKIAMGSVERTLIAQDIRTEQIDGLIRAYMDEDQMTTFLFKGEFRLNYQNSLGQVSLICKRMGDRLRLSIYPSTESSIPEDSERIVTAARVDMISIPPEESVASDPRRKVSGIADIGAPVPQKYSDPETPLELDLSSVPPGPGAEGSSLAADGPVPIRGSYGVRAMSSITTTDDFEKALNKLVEHNGSDLHLTAGLSPRYRVDGDIRDFGGPSIPGDQILTWFKKVAPPHAKEKFDREFDADFSFFVDSIGRFRINAFRDQRGIGMVVRSIPTRVPKLQELGLATQIDELCELDQGLVLVTGATGSGKSTTLASMLDRINTTRPVHVITIEDPVEFVHEPREALINQRELHVDTKSFSKALRAALREDPDVILLGELRDRETTEIALEVADTGHLVFGTLHTRSASNTIARIIEQFESSEQSQIRNSLAESLRAVISQTLCKAIAGGRVAAFEILLGTPAVANLVREGKAFQIMSVIQTSRGAGMRTLNDDLVRLVQKKLVTPEEAQRRAYNKTELAMLMKRVGASSLY
ncbi:MAG: type IV pilus twitching motility protein PilT [Myxococcota bacterium]|nr:type IV pilus twitching motility protein PilT [Myxococcota bacterium]